MGVRDGVAVGPPKAVGVEVGAGALREAAIEVVDSRIVRRQYGETFLDEEEATRLARSLVEGPTFAHSMTKNMLNQEWNMSIEQALEAEAQAQAICMQSEDFRRAFEAFSEKRKPEFVGR